MNTKKGKRRNVKIIVEKNVPATMRDGTVLRADIYRPDAAGKVPVLLTRTLYDKASDESTVAAANTLSERGYGVVCQDVRGRFASDGELRPGFYSADHSDTEDGYDTVEWAAKLPWSTGKVGTFGGSYDGWTQWVMGPARPPHLTTMFPSAIAANLLDREMSGVLRLGRVMSWTINHLTVDSGRRAGAGWSPKTLEEADYFWNVRDRSKWLWYLPLMEIPDHAMPGMEKHWRRWLEDHATDHFGFEAQHKEVDIPVLTVTGWYDQQIGAIKQFTGLTKNGKTDHARDNARLIVGPWTHTTIHLGSKLGDMDFGPGAARDWFDMADHWFGRWLKGERSDADAWPPIQLFVMGANTWRAENEWPLARTAYTKFYLRADAPANAASGNGALSRDPPRDEPTDQYLYDPRDPVMTLFSAEGQLEPIDQRALDGRQDILSYSTAPLETPIEVTGPIQAELYAASSAPDTDFIAKLIDVWPDGFTQELCHGIVRARYRESYENPSLIEPSRAYAFTIQMNPTSNQFRRGHRIRLDISSSDFPNFDRNHNVGADDYSDPVLKVARQTIFHDAAHPSHIVLPIIP